MYNPIATYRIQFHKDFNFEDFEKIISYLQKLGVRTIYASPILASTSGSIHGYDGIDPEKVNPEIEAEDEFKRIVQLLNANGIGWLQDIVPNHMAFDMANKWLWDVLEKGQSSEYAMFFDIDWDNELTGKKLMVPFLSEPIENLIRNGDVSIGVVDGKKVLECSGINYPLNHESLELIADINIINHDKEKLVKIIEQQFYRLCHWQETDTKINYRRFFTINGLICLNIQDDYVFNRYHSLIKKFVNEGLIDGLRIDHVDGLYNPKKYVSDLRRLAGEETFVVVEKILAPGEELERQWPAQGTTGYDFLAVVNNLLTNRLAKNKFEKFCRQFTGDNIPVQKQIQDKKALVLYNHMQGELTNLLHLFKKGALLNNEERLDVSDEELKSSIGEFLVRCPVYRYYGGSFPLSPREENNIKAILDDIELHQPQLLFALNLLRLTLIEKPHQEDKEYCDRVLHFYRRCMQFTGPLMAKGVEDTLMYSYNNFIGHNDVGDAPDAFGYSIEEFHQFMIDRQANWPMSINATSTHDTKRGEDTRARLAVLTDIANEWIQTVKQWHKLNRSAISQRPDKNDEYFIYQSLIGAYPMTEGDDGIESRMHAYLEKSLREAKRHSNWVSPDIEYEEKAKGFLSGLLNTDSEFYKNFSVFFRKIVDHGIINSLTQLILKFTCPGIPDVYQGTELWDLSLVDPDNRRPVDYQLRFDILNDLQDHPADVRTLWKERYSGKIKLWLTHQLFLERSKSEDVFKHGMYLQIEVKGRYKDNVIAFARIYEKQWYIIAVPLHIAQVCSAQKCEPINVDWVNTRLVVPGHAPTNWNGLLSDVESQDREIMISDIFSEIPLQLLVSTQINDKRKAGILAAISSLPSKYGVGDIGPAAYDFADFLHKSCQTYWQLLPLNPISASSSYSPYSSISAMAGNILLISPELLVDAGLLSREDLSGEVLPSTNTADYQGAEQLKLNLLEKAYRHYINGDFPELKIKFNRYCTTQKYWIDDFSMFVVLKRKFDNVPWYQWEDDYKSGDIKTLTNFSLQYKDELDKVKWFQFVFSLQWKDLKCYCGARGIKLFGDVPFYVNHDSADVWANRAFFSLEASGNMTGIAGVPPDYFSKDGQLWSMPTFNWQELKAKGYDWWIKRLKRNLELFDLIRLDHFRAFAEYWEVPAGEETARNGEWFPGPGEHFFEIVKSELGKSPFIAEDLGDNMEAVYRLRNAVGLPGMKVLQFAFGNNMADSVDIPHNYPENCIVYTGTHDNNTTIGWFNYEVKKEDRRRLQEYVGKKVTENNVNEVLSRLAYASVAETVILPLQDILRLDERNRMNTPGSGDRNWLWRFTLNQLTPELERQLREWTRIYNRY
jgi:malto-oligosyltrehalose synthase/4-alpha-glucanotransferase